LSSVLDEIAAFGAPLRISPGDHLSVVQTKNSLSARFGIGRKPAAKVKWWH
jgi:hypothetical protein